MRQHTGHRRQRSAREVRHWGAALLIAAGSTTAAERPTPVIDGLRDPMEPAGFATAPAALPPAANPLPEYRLQAIKIDTRFRTALINDHLVTEGTTLGEARVLKIRADEVVIGHHEQLLRLKLNPHAIKHPARTVR